MKTLFNQLHISFQLSKDMQLILFKKTTMTTNYHSLFFLQRSGDLFDPPCICSLLDTYKKNILGKLRIRDICHDINLYPHPLPLGAFYKSPQRRERSRGDGNIAIHIRHMLPPFTVPVSCFLLQTVEIQGCLDLYTEHEHARTHRP